MLKEQSKSKKSHLSRKLKKILKNPGNSKNPEILIFYSADFDSWS
jgi:hypothetical protein